MNTSAFTNDIFQMTGRTASRKFIDQVLNELCQRIRNGLPLHTPEAVFIEEHISRGGKAVLKDIEVEYRKWCKRNGYVPVNTGLRREIEFRTRVSLKDIKISGKKYHGFQGISLK